MKTNNVIHHINKLKETSYDHFKRGQKKSDKI